MNIPEFPKYSQNLKGVWNRMDEHRKFTSLFVSTVVLLVGLAVGLTLISNNQDIRREAASDGLVLSLNASDQEVAEGEAFTVDVVLSTGTHTVSGVQLEVDYDDAKLDLTGVVAGNTSLKQMLLPMNFDLAPLVYAAGATCDPECVNFQGSGVVARLQFVAQNSSGPTEVTLTPSTTVSDLHTVVSVTDQAPEVFIPVSLSNVTVTVNNPSAPTVTPVPQDTPTPTTTQLTPAPTQASQQGCTAYCQSQGFSQGTCRQNQRQCERNSETYSPDGNAACPGANESDCCCS